MKCAEGFKKYYAELEKDFHRLLLEVLEQYRATTVNDLRANLEKQRAFFALLAALDPGFSPDLAATAFGKIYPKAGKVLDRETALSLVTAMEAGNELKTAQAERLGKQVRKAREKFRVYTAHLSLVPVKRLASLIRSRLKFLPEEGLRERFQAYVHSLFGSLQQALEAEGSADEDLDLISASTHELYFNLLLIRRLCASPQDLPDPPVAHLEHLKNMLTGHREVLQTLKLSAIARKEWPAALVRQLQQEGTVRSAQVRLLMEQMNDDLSALEESLLALLATEPLEGGKPVNRSTSGNTGNIHPSFGQINVDEGIK